MHDIDRQNHIANLTAFRSQQLTQGSPMYDAIGASLKLLEREPAIQALLARLHDLRTAESVSGAELARLIDAMAKGSTANGARLRLVNLQEE
jgi:hypothetical protein